MVLTIYLSIVLIILIVVVFLRINTITQNIEKIDRSLSEIKFILKKQETPQKVQQAHPEQPVNVEPAQQISQEVQPIPQEVQPIPHEVQPIPVQTVPLATQPEKVESIVEENIPASVEVKAPVIPEVFIKKPIHQEAPKKPNFIKSFFNESLLGKIGIITLVAGIGFFVKHAIDQNWINEIGRVSIGILTGVAIIGLAHYLSKRYRIFSAILTGGGISVLYITITLAFREYELFSQTMAFTLLVFVTVFSVFLSLLYDRKELALFSLLGGYASPLLISTGSGNYIVLFSFILILNTGMLLISMRKNWTIIKIVSFVSTVIFYFSWLLMKFDEEYLGATIFASLFFVQFYIVTIFDHLLSGNKLTPFQIISVLGNNMSLLLAGYYIFNDFETNYLGLITILIAAVNACIMIFMLRNSKIDKNMIYLLIAVVLSLISLAVPIQLKGHVITLFWAAEAVILTWLWQKTRIRILNAGFQLIHLFTLFSWMMDIQNNYNIEGLPVIINRMFITGLVIITAQIVCYLILRKESSEKIFTRILIIVSWITAYFVPFFELKYHFEAIDNVSYLPIIVIFAWTITYLVTLTKLHHKKLPESRTVWGLIITIGISALFMLTVIKWSRYDLFIFESEQRWFLLHYLVLPGLLYMFYYVISNIHSVKNFITASWIIALLGVIIILSEADNTLIQIWGNQENYRHILHDMHTFGYPIICGLIAMALMIWGLQKKEIILRKISLAFFGIIILKFYLIDVWRMSQTGRIFSFVILGAILLVVYFLLQKIKGLVTDKELFDNESNEKLNH